jgi:protein phosphatase
VLEAGFEGSAASELGAVARAANAAVFNRAAADPALVGMCTTVCCAGLVGPADLVVVNVGDSRAYVLHEGDLRQITDDHTVTAELVRRGALDASAAAQHPHRHVLTRVLGGGPAVDADTVIIGIADGDVVMLCTDGLTKELSNEELEDLMIRGGSPSDIANRLVDRALAAGSDDNVTVVVARVAHRSPAR